MKQYIQFWFFLNIEDNWKSLSTRSYYICNIGAEKTILFFDLLLFTKNGTHRDYTSNGSVQVMLFRNRLEVWNPGQLPYGLTVNKLLEPHKSLPANPLIADPLFWTGYVDKVGTGTEDIVNLCKDKGLQSPEYHQEEDFRVVIWRKRRSKKQVNVKEIVNA